MALNVNYAHKTAILALVHQVAFNVKQASSKTQMETVFKIVRVVNMLIL